MLFRRQAKASYFGFQSAFACQCLGSLLGAGLAGFVLLSTGASASAGGGGVLLRQQSNYGNAYVVRAVSSAIRVDHKSGDFYLISKAPDWNVQVVRPKTREIAVVSHKDWCQRYQFRNGCWTTQLIAPLRSEHKVKDGEKVIVYYFGHTTSFIVAEGLFRSSVGARDKKRADSPNHAEVTCLEFPNGLMSGPVIGRLQNGPVLDGLPLSIKRHYDNGRVNGTLETTVIERLKDIPAAIFALPEGFKTVPFRPNMLQTSAQTDNTEALFKEFLGR